MTMEDIRIEGKAGRIGTMLTSVILKSDSGKGKQFLSPTNEDLEIEEKIASLIETIFDKIPFGIPNEPTPKGGTSGASRAFSVDGYGYDKWYKMFTPRQLLVLGTFVKYIRKSKNQMKSERYSKEWIEAIQSYLAAIFNKVTDYNSAFVQWQPKGVKGANTFKRWALPIIWDFVENNILLSDSGGWKAVTNWVIKPIGGVLYNATKNASPPIIMKQSALQFKGDKFDIIVTDPPYYDSIPYSDCMDFFYIWLRRILHGLSKKYDDIFKEPLSPKWNDEENDGELIDDSGRFEGDGEKSKKAYENGMYNAFRVCNNVLKSEGRLVIVFANKQPDAWETLVNAIIKAGFVVEASWPIETEMSNRSRSLGSAALSSSVWLVCKKRPENAKPGWDTSILKEMREQIITNLRRFWDAGIRGPDFVWAATGPALKSYSAHPIVKKANQPNSIMSVSEFLQFVRRLVVDFVVGRVLSQNEDDREITGLDDVTTYYLLHRYDFGLSESPIGPCIMYAISCNLSDKSLINQYDILTTAKKKKLNEENINENSEDVEENSSGSNSDVILKPWDKRKNKYMGYEIGNKTPPLIDQTHRLMDLWVDGDVNTVDEYINERSLDKNLLFFHIIQALIELSEEGSRERSILESVSNHLGKYVETIPMIDKWPNK
jgi:adenine-specific DNA methylase